MELTLTEEQHDFVAVAREFLEREAVPHRAEWDRAESIDTAFIPRMGDQGFFGLTIPEEYGGIGGDMLSYVLALEELGRVDSSLRGLVSVSLGLVGKSILSHGTEEQKQRWLPGICAGTGLGCFALTEPDTGSDAAALRTSAVRTGDDYIINGSKIFITNGTWAKVCLLFARTGGSGPRGISAFLVDTSTPGFSLRPIEGKLGLRGQATAELTFEDMRVPADCMLGAEGAGFKLAMSALDKGRISVASGCVGIVQACLEESVAYVKQRNQFGKPIAGFQLVQEMIAEMSVDADAARMLVWRACDLVMRGEPFGTAASKAKYFASEAAVRAANLAVQVHGGYGFIDEFPVQKFLRDARVMTLYEGTSQIQKLLIGRAETGVSAFL
ncbi:MAG TPA: acyl-CoA dehydrogenase family protein [Flexivirga sp.]|uniref:acyl-CoA dehydrogenase family protein n=1 Tax=Flexivirga sp. TaxID=1962927 RepID=UPI002BDB919B|nr:acyl-CoA dehydrogenase family protein [Flexivirga sp.]HWC22416.1 acyl-CoA dehydrogenase family protein [Flexivirga sp.]